MERQLFSYIRVSTTKQGEHGVSLQEQQEAILRYAQRNGLEISRFFEEQETAAKRGRPIFSEMVRLLRRRQARGVIIHKIDRGARNLKDWSDLGDLIDAGIEVHFANEGVDLTTRGGRLSADIQAVVAADYVRNLREETKKGFYGRLKQGIYPLGAPIGYVNCGGGKPKQPDPATAPLIREAFALYATGSYSMPRIVEEMYSRGLRNIRGNKVTLTGLATILHNPFYTGVIRLRKTGETFLGSHAPIISRELFEAARCVFEGKKVPRFRKYEFTFRRLVRCRGCNYNLIAESQKGHTYYRCHTPKCNRKSYREETIDDAVANVLAPLRMDDQERRYVRQWLTKARAEKDVMRAQELEAARMMLVETRDRLARVTDAYIDGGIDKAILEERRARLHLDEAEIKRRIAALEAGEAVALSRLEEFLELTQSASNVYKMAIPIEKREFVRKLTSNLEVDHENVDVALKTTVQTLANRPQVSSSAPEVNLLHNLLSIRLSPNQRYGLPKVVFVVRNCGRIPDNPKLSTTSSVILATLGCEDSFEPPTFGL